MSHYYSKEATKNLARLKEMAPEQLQGLLGFGGAVFQDGALTAKEKELVAVAISHIIECPYCIDTHTKQAKAVGASLEELVEAVFVASAVEAGGAVTHATHIYNANDEVASDVYYTRSNLKKLRDTGKYASEGYKGYVAFNTAAMKEGKVSAKLKEIIATASGAASQCPYCIDVHTKRAVELGATKEELAEALLVTACIRAGGTYGHLAMMFESYEE